MAHAPQPSARLNVAASAIKGLSVVAVRAHATALVCLALGADKGEKYQAYLSPMPHNDAMHANFSGKGSAVATLEGETLTLTGAFAGLASAATKARSER